MTSRSDRSPFPGMDPYMESRWADIHATIIVYARNQLNSQLPDDFSARIEETLPVEEDGGSFLRNIVPDVRVAADRVGEPDGVHTTGCKALVIAEPILFSIEPPRLRVNG